KLTPPFFSNTRFSYISHLIGSFGPKVVTKSVEDGFDRHSESTDIYTAGRIEFRKSFGGNRIFVSLGCERIFLAGQKSSQDVSQLGTIFVRIGMQDLL
ncbi:MAG: hypothetical protein NTV34_17230, partial [Proteobacteria bacterium]|nr:hypothetical protein [Pseudomonadota bacterium]